MEEGQDHDSCQQVEKREARVDKIIFFKIVSPLIGYAVYLWYTIVFDKDPFLVKWLEASFALFLALVLCNIIRGRLLPPRDPDHH